jgi:hypothetical protein
MKKILILLFSFFLLSSPSVFANDISDFQIEGISIGDSLLDYMTEEKILKEIERTKNLYFNLKEPHKYAEIYLFREYVNYDYLAIIIKNNSLNTYVTNKNEKYTILSVRGDKTYINDFDACIEKRNQISEVLSSMFINTDKSNSVHSHSGDPSGNSIVDVVYFNFDAGHTVKIYCDNFEETFRINKNWSEGLSVVINSKEINSWLSDY